MVILIHDEGHRLCCQLYGYECLTNSPKIFQQPEETVGRSFPFGTLLSPNPYQLSLPLSLRTLLLHNNNHEC